MEFGCYHLVSNLIDEERADLSLKPFLNTIEKHLGEELTQVGPAEIKKGNILPIIFIKSGGVEEKFKRIYQQFPPPYLLLTSCLNNSLPAALEIKTYLQKEMKKLKSFMDLKFLSLKD